MFRTSLKALALLLSLLAAGSSALSAPAKKNLALPQLPAMIGKTETVKVVAGKWNQKVTLSYQWILDGRPIKSATKGTYLVPESAMGKKLAVVETAKFSDGKTMFVTAASRVVGLLKVSGAAQISMDSPNSKLILSSPLNPNPATSKTITWYAGGSLIEAANETELLVDKRFESLGVYAKVKYSNPNYTPVSLTSNTYSFNAPANSQSTPIWADEFDGEINSTVNSTDWHDVTGNGRNNTDQYTPVATGWGNLERQYYLPGVAKVQNSDGAVDGKALLITATNQELNPNPAGPFDCWYSFNWRKERYNPPVNCEWVSGKITTENRIHFLYGHLEARIKSNGTAGTWPAFWMLGADYSTVGWPGCGEIDIHEGNGAIPNSNWGTLHGYAYWPGGQVNRQSSLLADWHVYAIDWKPNYIAFSLDGVVYKTITASDLTQAPWNLNLETNAWEFNKPQFAILNLAVGGKIIGNNNQPVRTIDINKDTKTMQIDYIRYSTFEGYGTLIRK
ncbi:MAG: glycoside hydrolase family 16 protein [Rhodoluna sp.]